ELAAGSHGGARSRKGLGPAEDQPWRFATSPAELEPRAVRVARNERCLRALLAALRERYAWRDPLRIHRGDRVRSFAAPVHEAPPGSALCLLFAELLEVGQDPQIGVRWREALLPAFTVRVRPACDPALLPASLPTLRRINECALTGRTADGIGYLMLGTFA